MTWARGAAVSAVAVSLLLVAGCSDDQSPDAGDEGDPPAGATADSSWSTLGDIDYLLAGELPEGWALAHAIERQGRPFDQWRHHYEVLATPERDRFLVIGVHEGPGEDRPEPGPVEPVGSDDTFLFTFLATVTAGPPPEGATAAQTAWSENRFSLLVGELAVEPDTDLIASVAEDLRGIDDLDFDLPASATSNGYERVGSSPDFPADLTEYTIVWRPTELAGDDREEAVASDDDGPSLFITVGSAFYTQAASAYEMATDADEAEVEREGDLLSLHYVLGDSAVSVRGTAVGEDELRALARGLRTVDRDDWVEQLGDRLRIDEPDP